MLWADFISFLWLQCGRWTRESQDQVCERKKETSAAKPTWGENLNQVVTVMMKRQGKTSIKPEIINSEVAQSCPTLCDPMDTRLLHPWDFLGKTTGVDCHFLLQGTSWPRDRTQVSHTVDRHFTIRATRECNMSVTLRLGNRLVSLEEFRFWAQTILGCMSKPTFGI